MAYAPFELILYAFWALFSLPNHKQRGIAYDLTPSVPLRQNFPHPVETLKTMTRVKNPYVQNFFQLRTKVIGYVAWIRMSNCQEIDVLK